MRPVLNMFTLIHLRNMDDPSHFFVINVYESNKHSVQKCCNNKCELVKCDWEIFYMNWICMSSRVNDMWHIVAAAMTVHM